MNSIDIRCEHIEPPDWVAELEAFAHAVLKRVDVRDWELSIVLTDNRFIRHLNRDYRGKDEPTDVLSFLQQHEGELPPAVESDKSGPVAVGDIVVSVEAVAANAGEFGVEFREELKRVVVHGILHLGGHTHFDTSPERAMLQLQERILSELAEEQTL